MLTLARVFDLYIDVDAPGGAPCLLDSRGAPRKQNDPVRWIVGDIFSIRIHFVRRPSTIDGSVEPVEQPASWALVLAGRADAETLYFSASSWVKVLTDDDVYYQADLSLDTQEAHEALSALSPGESLDVRVDLENQDATNAYRLTYQFEVKLVQQVYDGETVPTPEEPQYPAPGAIMVKIAGSAALTLGQDYVEVTGLGCATTPAVVCVTVRKPSGGATLFAAVVASSITTDGFRADLSGAPPATGYYLDYIIIL